MTRAYCRASRAKLNPAAEQLIEQPISGMRKALEQKKISCRELVLEYLSRIARFDSVKGGIRSISELNPDALFIADSLDRLAAGNVTLGPLHGIPILLKDNIDTGDKMATTAGSLALSCNFAEQDAFVVKKLREAGALILGKTSLTEFAQFLTAVSPAGYSSRGGQVLNPYLPGGVTPGGSSAGSGAAVAARLCAASVGSDTCGSIMSPTARNGLAGIRPTKGLISCAGVIPISGTMDTVGPMARSVEDLALLLGVMAGRNDQDVTTHLAPRSLDYRDATGGREKLRGRRIGVNMAGSQERDGEERKAFDSLLRMLEENGAVLVYGAENLDFNMDYQPMLDIMECEFKQALNFYLSRRRGPGPRTMSDVILYNQNNPGLMLKYGQERMLLCHNETTGAQTDVRYLKSMALREREIGKMNRLFEENQLDVVVRASFSKIAPLIGFPSMSIPIGQKDDKTPIGVCWIARRFDEARMIAVAGAVENILDLKLKPNLEARYPEI